MNQEAGQTRRAVPGVRDHDDGGASNAVKRPWSKPTVSIMHRIVRTDTGTNTIQLTQPENDVYQVAS